MKFRQFDYDPEKGELLNCNTGERQVLRQKLNTLLAYLIAQRERVVPKDELLETLWDNGEYRESSLTQSIRELRLALGDNAQAPSFIKTYQQRGYQWITPLEEDRSEPAEVTNTGSARRLSRRWLIGGLSATLALSLLLLWPQSKVTAPSGNIRSLMILPIVNESGVAALDWVELGLADMLSVEIQRSGRLRVTPPATSNAMLFEAGLTWPSLPAQLRTLMADQNIDAALFASFRLHNAQQVLDFQLIYRDGRTQQGAMSYSSLPESVAAISTQLLFLFTPDSQTTYTASKSQPGTPGKLAMQALAEGMGALQTDGPQSAHDFFQASYLLNKQEPLVVAYLAQTEILLGHWQSATLKLDAILSTEQDDVSLRAFAHYWKAELAHRRGDFAELDQHLSQAIALAEHIQNGQVMADSYRLKARVLWRQRKWGEHQLWLNKSSAIYPRGADLRIEAEKLFYLGNPIAYGLEKDPQQDLLLSKSRIEQAKNFYTQLGNRAALAASEFALAQNYTIDTIERDKSLQAAIDAYRALKMPYELSEVLIYAAFYKLQFRKGAQALVYVNEAIQSSKNFEQFLLRDELYFYEAFAYLDMGLDQSFLGLHGRNEELLNIAKAKFTRLASRPSEDDAQANALLMLAWSEMGLQQFKSAKQRLNQVIDIYRARQMFTTYAYAVYSLMKIHLDERDYQAVVRLGNEKVISRLQLSYLARAQYELGNFKVAADTFASIADQFDWREEDAQTLSLYRQAARGASIVLPAEPPAYSVYCESDWVRSFD